MTKNLPANMPDAVTLLTSRLAQRFGMNDVDPQELVQTLKATAFKDRNGNAPTDAQMTALLIVADQHGLNPWLKEIHAFTAQGGGIVPIVGVDGWSNIINNHPQMDGMEFEYDWTPGDEHITCTIWRKDRNRPIKVAEWLSECIRSTEPWKMKRRMLRHKAMMQCGRVAFSYGGIHDPDEAQDIIASEKFMGPAEVVQPGASQAAAATAATGTTGGLPEWSDAELAKREAKIAEFYGKGKSADDIIAFYSQKGTLSEAQKKRIRDLKPAAAAPAAAPADQAQDVTPKVTYAAVADHIVHAATLDALSTAEDLIGSVADAQQRSDLVALAKDRRTNLEEGGV